MSSLFKTYPYNTYPYLLQVPGGLTSSPVTVQDGIGNNTVLGLSKTSMTISGNVLVLSAAVTISGTLTVSSATTLVGGGNTLTLGNNLTTAGNFNTTLTSTATTNATLPSGTTTLASLSNNLGAFAATTSVQLQNIISDETGTGGLVFANTPTLITPILGTPTSGVLTNCTSIPVNAATGVLPTANGGVNQNAFSTYTPTVGGFTVAPTPTAYYKQVGKICFVNIPSFNGTSNSTSLFSITLPFTSAASDISGTNLFGAIDNGTNVVGTGVVPASSTVVNLTAPLQASWTASGTKGIQTSGLHFWYETG